MLPSLLEFLYLIERRQKFSSTFSSLFTRIDHLKIRDLGWVNWYMTIKSLEAGRSGALGQHQVPEPLSLKRDETGGSGVQGLTAQGILRRTRDHKRLSEGEEIRC